MQVRFQFWESGFDSWETMFRNAATFASQVPKDRLINISHSCDDNKGVVTVWYWADDEPSVAS